MELVVEALSCRRAGRRVVDGVGLRLGAGQAALLTGPNGAGKSSLLRALAGLIPLESGRARLGDADLRADPAAFQAGLAYAGHLDAVKPQLGVAENLRFWAALNGAAGPAADAAADAALTALGLAGIADLPAGVCSAGQKRRLGLARLLVAARPLWLLDEPTVSLDAGAVAAFAGLVRDHLARGGLVVAATHVPLGIAAAVEVAMAPPDARGAGAGGAEDPFLAGAWT